MFKATPLFPNDAQPADDYPVAEMNVLFSKHNSGDYIFSLGIQTIWTRRVERAGTDGIYIYINPDFWAGLTPEERAFVQAHEVEHIVYRDPERGKFYTGRGFHSMRGNERIEWDANLGNYAQDYRINANLVRLGMHMPDGGLLDERFTRESTMDEVYLELYVKPEDQPEQPDTDKSEEGEDGDQSDDSDSSEASQDGAEDDQTSEQGESEGSDDNAESDASGEPENAEGEGSEGEGSPEPSNHGSFDDHFEPRYEGTEEEQAQAAEDDKATIQEAVDQVIDTLENEGTQSQTLTKHFRAAGRKHSDELGQSTVRWEAEFADVMVRSGGHGRADYSRINKRAYMTSGSIVPRHKGVVSRLVFEIDVSGSVSRRMLGKALIEMAAAIDALRPTNGCLVLFTNTDVIEDHDVFSGEELLDLEVPNCGGTRMAAGVEWLENQGITDADIHIVFTDGYLDSGDWQVLGEAGVVLVLDRAPYGSTVREINRHNIRVIVATDTPLAR